MSANKVLQDKEVARDETTAVNKNGTRKLDLSFNINTTRDMTVSKIKDIYCSMVLSLKLTDDASEGNGSKSRLGFKKLIGKKKPNNFCFTDLQALECLTKPSVKVQTKTTVAIFSYQIKDDTAKDLLQLFITAKLLHFPQDRTRSILTSDLLLQPTPKGVAILSIFCQKNAITGDDSPPIILSNINSMQLISFERKEKTGALVFSEYWIKYLFVLMMGAKPHVWTPYNEPESIQKVTKQTTTNYTSAFTFELLSPILQDQENFFHYLHQKRQSANAPLEDFNNENSPTGNDVHSENSDKVSPFYHKYFTNPESDAHVQYYVSNTGIRALKDRSVQLSKKESYVIDYAYCGSAIIQWLMDCTDLIYLEEAFETANLVLATKVISLVNYKDFPKYTSKKRFVPDKTAWYRVTAKGIQLTHWKAVENSQGTLEVQSGSDVSSSGKDNGSMSSKSDSSFHESLKKYRREERVKRQLSLNHVLHDPGLKYLFRAHLTAGFCSENLDIYDEIVALQKRLIPLKKLLKLRDEAKMKKVPNLPDTPRTSKKNSILSAAVVELSNVCLTKIYNIYNTYLSNDGPYEVNINHSLKSKITEIMTHNTSPIQRSFSTFIQDYNPSKNGNGNEDMPFKFQHLHLTEEEGEIENDSLVKKSNKEVAPLESSSSSITNLAQIPSALTILETSQYNATDNDMWQMSPSDYLVTPLLKLIYEIAPLYEEVRLQIVKMMEIDSFPKFLNSSMFDEISNLLPTENI